MGKVAVAVNPTQRVPLQQKGIRQVGVPASNSAPVLAQRTTRSASQNENERPAIAPLPKRGPLRKAQTDIIPPPVDYEMEIEQPITLDTEIPVAPVESVPSPVAEEAYDEEDSMEAGEYDPEDWLYLSPDKLARSEAQVNAIRDTFKDEVDEWDTTMVSEYADEIFAYMESMEVCLYRALVMSEMGTQHVNSRNACQIPTTSLAKQRSSGPCAPLWSTG